MEIICSLPLECITKIDDKIYRIYHLKVSNKFLEPIKQYNLRAIIPQNSNEYFYLSLEQAKIIADVPNKNLALKTIAAEFLKQSQQKAQTKEIKEIDDHIIINEKKKRIDSVINTYITNKQGTWKIKNIIGMGRSCVAFNSILVKPSIAGIVTYLFKPQRIAKFFKFSGIEIKHKALEVVNSVSEEDTINMAKQLEAEQARINNICGLRTQTIQGGGILEDVRQGITLNKWLLKNSQKKEKKIEIFFLIVNEVFKLRKKGISHGDLNNIDNIMISEPPMGLRAKFIDFGETIKSDTKRLSSAIDSFDISNIEKKKKQLSPSRSFNNSKWNFQIKNFGDLELVAGQILVILYPKANIVAPADIRKLKELYMNMGNQNKMFYPNLEKILNTIITSEINYDVIDNVVNINFTDAEREALLNKTKISQELMEASHLKSDIKNLNNLFKDELGFNNQEIISENHEESIILIANAVKRTYAQEHFKTENFYQLGDWEFENRLNELTKKDTSLKRKIQKITNLANKHLKSYQAKQKSLKAILISILLAIKALVVEATLTITNNILSIDKSQLNSIIHGLIISAIFSLFVISTVKYAKNSKSFLNKTRPKPHNRTSSYHMILSENLLN